MISTAAGAATRAPAPDQQIRFCRGRDGVRLAYAIHGTGPPVVVVSCWLSHLQHDWQSPVWRHFLDDLGEVATVVRYDERGFGLSDWNVDDFSLEARLGDLEAVLEATRASSVHAPRDVRRLRPSRWPTRARHPERVSRLILYGDARAAACRRRHRGHGRGGDLPEHDPRRLGARRTRVFRRVFTNIFIPDATEEQMRWFDDLQRMSTSPENAVASRIARQAVDIADELRRSLRPDARPPGDRRPSRRVRERGRVASLIPNAGSCRSTASNHILLADEPAWRTFMDEVAPSLSPSGVPTRRRAGAPGRERAVGPRARRPSPVPRTASRTTRSPTRSASAREPSSATSRTSTASSASRASRPRRGGRHLVCAPAPDRAGYVSAATSPLDDGRSDWVAARFRRPPPRLRSGPCPADAWLTRQEDPTMAATRSPRPRPRFREDPATARSTPTVTATLANGRARLSRRAVQLGRRPRPGRSVARTSRRARRRTSSGRSPAAPSPSSRHARPAVRRPLRRRLRGRARARPTLRGLLGFDGRRRRRSPTSARDRGQRRPTRRIASRPMLAAWRERCPIYLALLRANAIDLQAKVAAVA